MLPRRPPRSAGRRDRFARGYVGRSLRSRRLDARFARMRERGAASLRSVKKYSRPLQACGVLPRRPPRSAGRRRPARSRLGRTIASLEYVGKKRLRLLQACGMLPRRPPRSAGRCQLARSRPRFARVGRFRSGTWQPLKKMARANFVVRGVPDGHQLRLYVLVPPYLRGESRIFQLLLMGLSMMRCYGPAQGTAREFSQR